MHQQFQPKALHSRIPEADHFPELPVGINMQQGEGQLARVECLQRQMQQHADILPDGIEQYRAAERASTFAQNANRFGFKAREMGCQASQAGHYFASQPPSTGSAMPVVKLAVSLAR